MNKTMRAFLIAAASSFLLPLSALLLRADSHPMACKEVPLLTEIDAPILADGKQIGSMKLKPGSLVTVISSDQQNVMVRRGDGAPFPVPCSALAPEALAAALATPTPAPPPPRVAVVQPTPSPTPVATPTSSSPVFFDKLRPLLAAPYEGKSPRYTAIYFSAHWCGPCRAFTPKLVTWYKSFRRYHPDFELVFSSCDKDPAAMEEYIKLTSMPWPVLAFEKKNTRLLSSYFPKGIPCLVFLDEQGNPVTPNPGNKYIPPEEVLRTIERTVPSSP